MGRAYFSLCLAKDRRADDEDIIRACKGFDQGGDLGGVDFIQLLPRVEFIDLSNLAC